MRDEAIADAASSGGGAAAQAWPAALKIAAAVASVWTSFRIVPQHAVRSPVGRPAGLKIKPKIALPDLFPIFNRCTQFLYQVCQNYPPKSSGAIQTFRTGGTMSLDINGLAL
jgi:hypothetical protein